MVLMFFTYFVLGMFLSVSGIVIYHDIPREFGFNRVITINVANRAPIHILPFKPYFVADIRLVNASNTKCIIESLPNKPVCGSLLVELGEINPGESRSLKVNIFPHDQKISIRISIYLYFKVGEVFWYPWPVEVKIIQCEKIEPQGMYLCSES